VDLYFQEVVDEMEMIILKKKLCFFSMFCSIPRGIFSAMSRTLCPQVIRDFFV
jgi:hypothetical protein